MKLFNNKKNGITSSVKGQETISLMSKVAFLLIFVLSINFTASAQCKKFTKKHCLPNLEAYIHNGQLTSAYMMPGDSADVMMVFNAGKEYRLLICSQDMIGKVQFKVLDSKMKVLYESDEEEANPFWDFKMENTQQLFIRIYIPAKEKSNQKTTMVPEGCVSILVGFKE